MPTFRDLQHAYQEAGIIPQGNYMAFTQKEPRKPLVFGESPFVHTWKLVSFERWDGKGMEGITIVRNLTKDESHLANAIYWGMLEHY